MTGAPFAEHRHQDKLFFEVRSVCFYFCACLYEGHPFLSAFDYVLYHISTVHDDKLLCWSECLKIHIFRRTTVPSLFFSVGIWCSCGERQPLQNVQDTYILYMLDILFRIITMHCSFRAATPSRIFKAKLMLLCLYCCIAPEGPLWTPKRNTDQNQHLLTQLSCRNIWCIDRFEKRPLRYVDKPLRQQHSSSLLTLVDTICLLFICEERPFEARGEEMNTNSTYAQSSSYGSCHNTLVERAATPTWKRQPFTIKHNVQTSFTCRYDCVAPLRRVPEKCLQDQTIERSGKKHEIAQAKLRFRLRLK